MALKVVALPIEYSDVKEITYKNTQWINSNYAGSKDMKDTKTILLRLRPDDS